MGLGPTGGSTQQPILGHGLGKLAGASSSDWMSLLGSANPQLAGDIQNGGLSPQEQQAVSQIDQLTSGPVGSSPATAAGMRAYTANAQPSIEQAASLAGGGRGGALTAALTQGQEGAYVPLIQQEISDREAAVPQLAGIGNAGISRLMGLTTGPTSQLASTVTGQSGSTTSTPGIFAK